MHMMQPCTLCEPRRPINVTCSKYGFGSNEIDPNYWIGFGVDHVMNLTVIHRSRSKLYVMQLRILNILCNY